MARDVLVAQRTDLLHVPLHNLHWSNLLQVASLENMLVAQYESQIEMSLMSYICFSISLSWAPATMLLLEILWQSVMKFVTDLYTVNM